jgi:predicted dehydrogenase
MTTHIGLIGCGPWGANILRDLRDLGCEVTVVARHDTSVERAQRTGAHAIVRSFDDLPDIDGAVVATEATDHFRALSALLSRNIPIYCEKPITTDIAHVRTLLDLAPERIFVMHKWRYHPAIERTRQVIADGHLGHPVALRTTRHQWGTSHSDIDVSWTLMPHDLSIWLHLIGKIPEPVWAKGHWADGKLQSMVGMLGESPWFHLDISCRAAEHSRVIVVELEGGTITISNRDYGIVTVQELNRDKPTSLRVDNAMPLLAELRAFVQHVQGGPPPMSSLSEAAQVVERVTQLRRIAAD